MGAGCSPHVIHQSWSLELMPLTFGFPPFSETIQVCYPERKLSRRVPPRCPSPKPSSWRHGRAVSEDDISHHPGIPTSSGFIAPITNSKPIPKSGRLSDFGPSAFSPKCVSNVQPLPHAARTTLASMKYKLSQGVTVMQSS